MRTYLPFILTAIFCTGISLLISYSIWGPGKTQILSTGYDSGLTGAAEKGRTAVVFIYNIQTDTSRYIDASQTGSGVIISEDGYIVTNYHVIKGSTNILVQLEDRRELLAELVGSDSTHDVALLKVMAKGLSFLEFGDNDALLIGEPVLAVGNPYRLHFTVTSGIISAKDRDIKLANNATKNYIQTDAPINVGNSGGALLNAKGQLMGINMAQMSTSGQYEGFTFAIPSNLVKKVAEDLRDFGSLQRVSIGMTISTVSPDVAHTAGMDGIYGVVVEALRPGGAADVSGLQSQDIILATNKRKVKFSSDFLGQLSLYRPGDVLSLSVIRDGKPITVDVLLQEVMKETE